MKNSFRSILVIFLLTLVKPGETIKAQPNPEDPRFEMTVKNIRTTNPVSMERDSIILLTFTCRSIRENRE
ncbi:MAG: hypothetical protein IPL53_12700 [Ignavibacteria bacterium]|nr:hypothetical protein [Ignavibacteria bacterium]